MPSGKIVEYNVKYASKAFESLFTSKVRLEGLQRACAGLARRRRRRRARLSSPPRVFPAPHQSARASHILLKGPSATADALALKERIAAGEISFADAARDYSACPSSVKGGDLGTFKPGMMVPQFDEVIFNPSVAVGQLATAKTQFGTHVIQITERDMGDSA